MSAIESLKAVLLDPNGNVAIIGSEEDRRIIKESLADIEKQLLLLTYGILKTKDKKTITDVDEQAIVEQFCEACDGFYGAPCKYCDGFKIAYLMCELGLDEDWDWCVPAKGTDEKALLEALRLVKRTLIKQQPPELPDNKETKQVEDTLRERKEIK